MKIDLFNISKYTIKKGKLIGYIESIHDQGLFFSNNFIKLNNKYFSTYFLSSENKKLVDKLLYNKTDICIIFTEKVFGSPLEGNIFFPKYIHNIKILNDKYNIMNYWEEK
jgi:hypothetical protein